MKRRTVISAGLLAAVGLSLGLSVKGEPQPTTKQRIRGIDTHAHVFHRNLPFIPERRYTPNYDASPQDYLAMLDRNQISHGVIIPISILGTNNDYTVEVLQQYNDRLRGLAVIDPIHDIDKLSALNAAGIVGIRLNLIKKPVPELQSEAWKELISTCLRLDWQIEVYDDAARLAETVTPLVNAGVKVVVDHFGKPNITLGTEDSGFKYLCGLGKTGQVWVKLSAPYRSSDVIAEAAAPLLIRAFGPERLLWGSDWPHTGFEGKVDDKVLRSQLDLWVPDQDERQLILSDTPAKLFRFNSEML